MPYERYYVEQQNRGWAPGNPDDPNYWMTPGVDQPGPWWNQSFPEQKQPPPYIAAPQQQGPQEPTWNLGGEMYGRAKQNMMEGGRQYREQQLMDEYMRAQGRAQVSSNRAARSGGGYGGPSSRPMQPGTSRGTGGGGRGSSNRGRSYGASAGIVSSKGGKNVSTSRYRTQDDPTQRHKFDQSPPRSSYSTDAVMGQRDRMREYKADIKAKSDRASGKSKPSGNRRQNQSKAQRQTQKKSLAGSYADASARANQANESRYNEILGGFDALMGGGGGGGKGGGAVQSPRNAIFGDGMLQNARAQWQSSGSTLPFTRWLSLMRAMEIKAAQQGGQFGAMDASQVRPRMYGQGEYLQEPGGGGPSMGTTPPAPPYTMPERPPISRFETPERPIPSYATGTPYVPKTGLAQLHQGEAVIPANQNIVGGMMAPVRPTNKPAMLMTGGQKMGISNIPYGGSSSGGSSGGSPGGSNPSIMPAPTPNRPPANPGRYGNTNNATLGNTSRGYYDEKRSGLESQFGQRSDQLTADYQKRQQQLAGELEGYGKQQLADQSQRATNLQSSISQNMIDSGFANSSVAGSMALAGGRESANERARIMESIQDRKNALNERTSADTMGYRRGNESERLGLGQSNVRDSYGNYVGDRAFGEDQYRDDRNFGYDAFRDQRDFGQGAFERDRAFGRGAYESDRAFNRENFSSDRSFNEAKRLNDRMFGESQFQDRRNFDYQAQWDKMNRQDRLALERLAFMERREDLPPDLQQMIQVLEASGSFGNRTTRAIAR